MCIHFACPIGINGVLCMHIMYIWALQTAIQWYFCIDSSQKYYLIQFKEHAAFNTTHRSTQAINRNTFLRKIDTYIYRYSIYKFSFWCHLIRLTSISMRWCQRKRKTASHIVANYLKYWNRIQFAIQFKFFQTFSTFALRSDKLSNIIHRKFY